MRVFLDTNVLVSAFATRGACADLMRTVLTEHELVTSEAVLAELSRVLRRRIGYAPETIRGVVSMLREHHVEPTPPHLPDVAVRDPDDLVVLASAIASRADVLVTGDADLLAVSGQADMLIIDPRGFWTLLRGEQGSPS